MQRMMMRLVRWDYSASEIDDDEISEADMVSEKSHETVDDELDEISDLWGYRFVEAKD